MDQQHTLISQGEINAMKRIKALAEEVGALCLSFEGPVPGPDGVFFPDARWRAIAQTQLQQGFMSLARCIAQPTTF